MQFEKKITNNNKVLYASLPKALTTYLELDKNSVIVLQDEKGRHGKYISIWKK